MLFQERGNLLLRIGQAFLDLLELRFGRRRRWFGRRGRRLLECLLNVDAVLFEGVGELLHRRGFPGLLLLDQFQEVKRLVLFVGHA